MYNIISMSKGGNKGFTIVETLIVLAIAATIIIVVLLAVPALQRNSRNTVVKTAANNILSGWAAEVANSNGATPTTTAGAGTAGKITIGANSYTFASSVNTFVATATASSVAYGTTLSAAVVTPGAVVVLTTGVCTTPNTVATTQAVTVGTTAQVAILYPVEGTTGQVTCVQG